MDNNYTKREIDMIHKDIDDKLNLILAQTTKHNGRLTRVERVLLVVGTVMIVLLIVSGSELVSFISSIIL